MVIKGLQGQREREAETNTQILRRQETHEIKHSVDGQRILLGLGRKFRKRKVVFENTTVVVRRCLQTVPSVEHLVGAALTVCAAPFLDRRSCDG